MNRTKSAPRLRFISEWSNHQSYETNWGCGINPKDVFGADLLIAIILSSVPDRLRSHDV